MGHAEAPQIAIDANGNTLAVWHQFDGTNYSIWANRYNASSNSWGTANVIEIGIGIALFPQIAIDANGNALAVWGQSDGAFRRIFANRYTASSNSWGTAVAIQVNNVAANIAFGPKIAFDPSGNALAVWIQFDGTVDSIFANRYTASSNNWGTASVIETDIGSAFNPRIVFDPSGNALAVWEQFDGMVYSIFANRYTANSNSWSAAVAIEGNNIADNVSSFSQQIAVDTSGNALAVWHQFDGTAYSV